MNLLTEIKNRWNAESPKFFKKLMTFGITLTAGSASLIAIPGIPEIVHDIAGYMATAGAVIAFISKFAVKNPDYSTLDQPKE